MKIFWTRRAMQQHNHEVIIERVGSMWEGAVAAAAARALHRYTCMRTLDWWRNAIDEAEKHGTTKYMSLAKLVEKIEEENKK